MAILLSGAFATSVQAQRPERPAQGMEKVDRTRPAKGDKTGKPEKGMKGKPGMKDGKGKPTQDGSHMGKGQRPTGQHGPKAQK